MPSGQAAGARLELLLAGSGARSAGGKAERTALGVAAGAAGFGAGLAALGTGLAALGAGLGALGAGLASADPGAWDVAQAA
ncbi:MAG TPA: hypothetical protein VHM25_12855 [Polyangiaceae bacterium]|jgi:hypothetical protein|nr:hypothetical protein [Polyangiaceae bacterium]